MTIIIVGVETVFSTVCFADFTITPPAGQNYIECEGVYSGHLQGIATNLTDSIFWSFNEKLVRTDSSGKLVRAVEVQSHHGDLCYFNGAIYVAVNLGSFNKLQGASSWVYAYDATTLKKTAEFPVSQVKYGAGGIESHEGRFYVVGGLHKSETKNYVYEYDDKFVYQKTHELATGYTARGIQTVAFAAEHWWFGTYHILDKNTKQRQLFQCDQALKNFQQFSIDASWGIAALNNRQLLVGANRRIRGHGFAGSIQLAAVNNSGGLDIGGIPATGSQVSELTSGADQSNE